MFIRKVSECMWWVNFWVLVLVLVAVVVVVVVVVVIVVRNLLLETWCTS